MTKERVMELTDTVIDVAMNRDGFTDRERIKSGSNMLMKFVK